MTTARTDHGITTTPPEQQEEDRPRREDAPASAAQPPNVRSLLPWKGKATRTDKALLFAILGLVAVMLAMWPLRPFLIASHPVLLAFATGSKAAVGAAAAYARIGEIPLWLAVLAGTVGMAKFDWLFWWTGRQWGRGIVDMFAQGETAQRLADKAQHMNPWFIRVAVVFAFVPGVPGALVFALAGWTGMRLVTFMALDVLGSLIITGVVAGVGYGLGQYAVDVIIAIDDKALWVSLGIVVVMAWVSGYKAQRKAARSASAADAE